MLTTWELPSMTTVEDQWKHKGSRWVRKIASLPLSKPKKWTSITNAFCWWRCIFLNHLLHLRFVLMVLQTYLQTHYNGIQLTSAASVNALERNFRSKCNENSISSDLSAKLYCHLLVTMFQSQTRWSPTEYSASVERLCIYFGWHGSTVVSTLLVWIPSCPLCEVCMSSLCLTWGFLHALWSPSPSKT